MASYNFKAILKRPDGVGTWTYLDILVDVSATFGAKGQVKVKGTINGQPFRSSALPHGDGTTWWSCSYLYASRGGCSTASLACTTSTSPAGFLTRISGLGGTPRSILSTVLATS